MLEALVPRALDDNGLSGGESVPWEEDGEIWLQQRRRLADLFTPGVEPDADRGSPGDDGGPSSDDGGLPADDGSGKVEGSSCGCGLGGDNVPGLLFWILVSFLIVLRRSKIW